MNHDAIFSSPKVCPWFLLIVSLVVSWELKILRLLTSVACICSSRCFIMNANSCFYFVWNKQCSFAMNFQLAVPSKKTKLLFTEFLFFFCWVMIWTVWYLALCEPWYEMFFAWYWVLIALIAWTRLVRSLEDLEFRVMCLPYFLLTEISFMLTKVKELFWPKKQGFWPKKWNFDCMFQLVVTHSNPLATNISMGKCCYYLWLSKIHVTYLLLTCFMAYTC